MTEETPLSEQWYKVAQEWVEAEGAASLLEDTKSSALSQQIAALGDMPFNRAEATVKASPEWMDHLGEINKARTKANELKVHMEYLRMKFQEYQSAEANNRTQARL